ncbi:flagellar protein FlgN [Albidovulum sp.]
MEHSDGTAERLTDFLRRERRAILAGDLPELIALAPEGARLVEAIEGHGRAAFAAAADLAAIKAQAETNRRLLEAALAGIGAARRRLAEVARARDGLDTYDRHGAAQSIDLRPGRVERRA